MTCASVAGRRWRPRFTLRSLLVLTLVCSCFLAWYVSEARRARIEQEAVASIRAAGGNAHYRQNARSGASTSLLDLGTHDYVERVSIHHAHDQDLEAVGSLRRLVDLRLNSRHVTDDGIRHLKTLRRLERLDLWCRQVTDQGLQPIGRLKNLTELNLYSTQVTDAGLVHLEGLTNLRKLNVRDTGITQHGAAILNKSLPNCRIEGVKTFR